MAVEQERDHRGIPTLGQSGEPSLLHGNQSLVVGPQASREWDKGDSSRKRTAVTTSTQYSQHGGIIAVLANVTWAGHQHTTLDKPDQHI